MRWRPKNPQGTLDCPHKSHWIVGMKAWTLFINVLLWPGRKTNALFPHMGEEEARLIHNVVNYVVWLALFCGVLVWTIIKHPMI